jgi:hypothetical protein
MRLARVEVTHALLTELLQGRCADVVTDLPPDACVVGHNATDVHSVVLILESQEFEEVGLYQRPPLIPVEISFEPLTPAT